MAGQTLSQEEIDNIVEEWKRQDDELPEGEEPTFTDVADELPHSKSTVSKYIKQWKNEYDPGEAERAAGDGPEDEFTAAPPGSRERVESDGPDFGSMSHGDFIKWFFNQDGFGVRSSFANTLARKCDVRGKIPDRAEIANEIISGNSGISNGHQASSLAEVYWDAAQRFLRAKGDMGGPGQAQGGQAHAVGGSWTGEVNGQSDGINTDNDHPGGEWVGTRAGEGGPGGPERAPPYGNGGQGGGSRPTSYPQDRRGGRGRHGGPSAGPGAGPGGPGQGPPQRDPELIEAIGELKDTQELLLRRLSQQDGQNPNDLKSQAEQLAEARKAMEDAFDSGGNDAVSEIRQDLRTLREEINRVAEGSSEEIEITGDDNGLGALVRLATETDMSEEKIATLAESMGMSDPEVEKEKYRLRREEERARNRREMINDFVDAFGDAGGEFVSTLMREIGKARQGRRDDGRAPPEGGPPRREGMEEPRYDAVERVTERRGEGRRAEQAQQEQQADDRVPPAKRRREEAQSAEPAEPVSTVGEEPKEGKTDSLDKPESIMDIENEGPDGEDR